MFMRESCGAKYYQPLLNFSIFTNMNEIEMKNAYWALIEQRSISCVSPNAKVINRLSGSSFQLVGSHYTPRNNYNKISCIYYAHRKLTSAQILVGLQQDRFRRPWLMKFCEFLVLPWRDPLAVFRSRPVWETRCRGKLAITSSRRREYALDVSLRPRT